MLSEVYNQHMPGALTTTAPVLDWDFEFDRLGLYQYARDLWKRYGAEYNLRKCSHTHVHCVNTNDLD